MSRSNPTSWMSIAFLWFRHYACLMKRQHLGQYNMGLDLIWVFFVGFSVWGTFPFYLLHFGAKTFPLLNFGAKIYHLHYSSMFSMVFKSMVLHNLSMVFIDVFRGFTHFFHSVHWFIDRFHGLFHSFHWAFHGFNWFVHSFFHAEHAPGEHVEYRLKHNCVESKQWLWMPS